MLKDGATISQKGEACSEIGGGWFAGVYLIPYLNPFLEHEPSEFVFVFIPVVAKGAFSV